MSATNGSNPRLDRIEKLIEQTVRATKEADLANQKAHTRFKSDLRRWAALGVKEARNQRRRAIEMDKKFDKKIDQLASAQLLTEEALRKFIASTGRASNGH